MGKTCNRCGKRSMLEGSEHCGICLCEIIEKRAEKSLAGTSPTRKLAIASEEKFSLGCVAASFIVQNTSKHVKPRIIRLPDAERLAENGTTVLTAKCSDDAAIGLLQHFLSRDAGDKECHAINVLESITEKELELYAAIKRLKYAKAKKDSLKQGIQALQSRYPGTVEALARSSRKINELMKR
ncbi:hypothetical protein HYU17_00885 [Candidatus Woesearchaeota archaeon]|nr:hypothetical protein [Candidatus Woesearchaeota archaeon]